ncbi:MAG TPA: lysophospholipid acyltransferase family protein [Chthoniobacterales bacterium]|jgi:lauroyl/myristoyl acyltransferase
MRNRIEWLGLSLAMSIVPIFPRSVCYMIGQILGTLAYFFHGSGRRVALANLEAAFGTEMTNKERRRVARQSYRTFATTLVDLLWSSRLTPQNFRHYVDLEDLENLEDETGQRHIDIGISIHYGNFEWISLAMGFLGFPADIVAERSKNPLLEPLMRRARSVSGHTMIPRERAMVRLYRTLRQGGHVAVLIDLNVRPTQPAVIIDCFGMQTCVTLAHAWLQQRTGRTIMAAHCEPLPGGRYRIGFHPKVDVCPGASATQIAQACWDSFEPLIRRKPGAWLWMYKHWRFQPKDSPTTYPFYANTSPHFEKLKRRLREAEFTQVPVQEDTRRIHGLFDLQGPA